MNEQLMTVIIMVIVSAIALWRNNPVPFIIAGGLAWFTGLQWFDVYSTTVGMAVSVGLIAWALFCWADAFKLIFYKE